VLVGETPFDNHTTSTGDYALEFPGTAGAPNLETCAIVVSTNETTTQTTADAKATGEREVTVMTYDGTTLTDEPFSINITC